MPKQSSSRRSIRPIVPRVAPETWKALVAAADKFSRLAPWEWMHDSHVIGLRHPVTKEVLLGSILGQLKQVFALLLYRNDAGRRWILNMILDDGEPGGFECEEAAFEQDLIKVEFVLKRELVKEDQAVLATAGFTPANKRGCVWPQFRNVVPGGFPWHVTQAEAETLLFALPRVAAVARLLRARPYMWDDHCDGQIGFVPVDFDPSRDELRAENLEWQPMVPPPEPSPEAVSFDETTLARLMKLTQAKGFHLELDVTYAPFPIADELRPRFPRLAMAVDRASGFVGGLHLGESNDCDGAGALGVVLRNTLTQLGHRPEVIRVQRPRVAAMLATVAGQLGIPILPDSELAELNRARENMAQHFSRTQ
ncbi:MAG TPA: hypothetical protein VFZ59_02270 [Verrucomicrobiae bacterium]|nr:hypothetical protein [Verrucomicrobiae bacterium]